jgi:hypothetical protein
MVGIENWSAESRKQSGLVGLVREEVVRSVMALAYNMIQAFKI